MWHSTKMDKGNDLRKAGGKVKKIIYTETQVKQIRGLLNGLTIMGIQNAKQVAVISQILDEGLLGEVSEEKKEGD